MPLLSETKVRNSTRKRAVDRRSSARGSMCCLLWLTRYYESGMKKGNPTFSEKYTTTNTHFPARKKEKGDILLLRKDTPIKEPFRGERRPASIVRKDSRPLITPLVSTSDLVYVLGLW